MISVNVDASDTLRILRRPSGEIVLMLRRPMTQSLGYLTEDLAHYPPTRIGQHYIRGRGPTNASGEVTQYVSEQLGKRWTESITVMAGVIMGETGNNVSYGPYVQDADEQAWMHRGRWQTNVQVAEDNTGEIEGSFADAIDAYLLLLSGG